MVDASREFDCGCHVSLVYDDGQGDNYPGAPSVLFDFERCGTHSLTVADPGPIDKFIEDYVLAHPMKKARHVDPPPAPPKVEGCGRGNHDYKLVSGKSYAKCSKCTSTRTVGGSVFHTGVVGA